MNRKMIQLAGDLILGTKALLPMHSLLVGVRQKMRQFRRRKQSSAFLALII